MRNRTKEPQFRLINQGVFAWSLTIIAMGCSCQSQTTSMVQNHRDSGDLDAMPQDATSETGNSISLVDADIQRATDANAAEIGSPDSAISDSGNDTSPSTIVDSGIEASSVIECDLSTMPADITTLVGVDINHPVVGLVIENNYLYFLSQESRLCVRAMGCSGQLSLNRVPYCGGVVEDLGFDVDYGESMSDVYNRCSTGYDSMASGGEHLYFISRRDSIIYRIKLSDASHEQLEIANGCISDIAVSDSDVFVYDGCNNQILRTTHSDTRLEPFADAGDGGFLALTSEALYYSQGMQVWKQTLTSEEAQLFYTAPSHVMGLAADDNAVIVVHGSTIFATVGYGTKPTVTLVPVDGDDPLDLGVMVSSLWSGTSCDLSPSVRDGRIYYRKLNEYNIAQVTRIDTDNRSQLPVLRRAVGEVTSEDDRLYWKEEGGIFTSLPQTAIAAGPIDDSAPIRQRIGKWVGANTRHMAVSPDGSIFIIVEITSELLLEGIPFEEDPATYNRKVLIKLSSDGGYDWSASLVPEQGYNYSYSACVVIDSTGNVTAVVEEDPIDSAVPSILAFHRYRPDGTKIGTIRRQIWNSMHRNECVIADNDDIYLAAGPYFARLDANGNQIWKTENEAFVSNRDDVSPWETDRADIAITEPGFVFTNQKAVIRVTGDGEIAWSYWYDDDWAIARNVRVTADEDGRVLVMGKIRDSADKITSDVVAPRPLEPFTFMLWFDAEGNIESQKLLDGVFNHGDIAAGQDGNAYLVVGTPDRPFYFEPPFAPGNFVYRIAFAKIDSNGELVYSRNLSTHIDSEVPNGYLGLVDPRLVVTSDRVVLTGTINADSTFPPRWYDLPVSIQTAYSEDIGYLATFPL